ncbi:MAG TPA: FAD-dependent oxidoreductase [Acidimicrobiales bacterium]
MGPAVAIVGGGPSGLAAAHHLRRRGCTVVVIDEGARVGGKLQTVRHEGFVMETGAALVSSAYDALLEIAVDIGVAGDLVPAASGLSIARDGRVHRIDTDHLLRDGIRTGVLSWRSKVRALRLAIDGWKARAMLSFEDLSVAAPIDVETAEEYCRRRLNDEIYDYVVDSTMRGINGTSGSQVSVVEFFFAVAKVLGSDLFSFRGGMSSFAEAMVADLDVRTESRVSAVADRGDAVIVEWVDHVGAHRSEVFDGCVVAIAGDLVPSIVHGLDTEAVAFLESLRYSSMVNLNLARSSAPAESWGLCLQIPRPVSERLFTISFDHTNPAGRAPSGAGLLGLYTTAEWAQELIEADDDVVVAAVLDEAERVLPGCTDDAVHVRVNRWPRSLVYSRPGLYRALGRFQRVRGRAGRVALAGDYFSSSNLNTAATAGRRAARELAAVLGSDVGAPTGATR